MKLRFLPALLLTLLLISAGSAFANEACIYQSSDGTIKQVNSLTAVPEELRHFARCFQNKENPYLAKPQEIQLSGNIRRELLNSSVGPIHLRWPRKIEGLFGRTPLRAMTDASQTVSKALKRSSVPGVLQKLNLDWQVIFLDADLPETQIPAYLISNCHPGWMTPPANIYIVGQRVAGGCGGLGTTAGVADSKLTEVLVHEMGHAVEYALLEGMENPPERMRKEGFATWFESYAADFSSLMNRREIDLKLKEAAKSSIRSNPSFNFQGSGEDYARAAIYFRVVEHKRGVQRVFELYDIVGKGRPLIPAILESLNWNEQMLDKELRRYLDM
jgi:hypothetical protein